MKQNIIDTYINIELCKKNLLLKVCMRKLSKQFLYLTGMMHDVYGNSTQSMYYGNKPLSRRRAF